MLNKALNKVLVGSVFIAFRSAIGSTKQGMIQ